MVPRASNVGDSRKPLVTAAARASGVVSGATMGSESQCAAWSGVVAAATPSGPTAEAWGVLAASVEDEA